MEEGTVEFIDDKKKESLKATIVNIWKSTAFHILIDGCRIALVVLLILILWKLVTEIETVKILASDVCAICMNKTGAYCFLP